MRVLELFSGTGSVGKVCKEMGWEVVSLDIDAKNKPDICVNIMDWKPSPNEFFDVVWASPPCHRFSLCRKSWIGRKIKYFGDRVVTREMLDDDMIKEGLPILHKTLDIIAEIDPTYWFIENPFTSDLKRFIDAPCYTVDYCRYCDWGYKKRTNIWTNLEDFEPKLCNKQCGNMLNGKHRIGVGHESHKLSINEKYRIPPNLIKDLFKFG